MPSQIQFRRDTAANWTANNPVLAQGEKGIETDNLGTANVQYKIGDGSSDWNTLPYQAGGSGSGDMLASVYDPQSVEGDAFLRSNHTGSDTVTITYDDATVFSGVTAAYTVQTGNITKSFSLLSGLANGSYYHVDIIDGDGSSTFTLPSDVTLQNGTFSATERNYIYYWIEYISGLSGTVDERTQAVITNVPIPTTGVNPTVTSFTVNNGTEDEATIVYSQAVNGDLTDMSLTGFTPAITLDSIISGVGTNTWTVQMSRALTNGETGNFVYGASNTVVNVSDSLPLLSGSTSVTNNVDPLAPPTFTSAEIGSVDSSTLTITVNENCNFGTTGISLTASGGALSIVANTGGNGTTTGQYSLSRAVANGETVTVDFADPNGVVSTSTGLDLEASTGNSVTNNVAAPPSFVSAEIGNVDADTLTITINENCNYDITGITINTDGDALSIVANTAGDGTTTGRYSLSRSILSSETLTLDFASTNGIISVSSGLDLDASTGNSITNNVSEFSNSFTTEAITGGTFDESTGLLTATTSTLWELKWVANEKTPIDTEWAIRGTVGSTNNILWLNLTDGDNSQWFPTAADFGNLVNSTPEYRAVINGVGSEPTAGAITANVGDHIEIGSKNVSGDYHLYIAYSTDDITYTELQDFGNINGITYNVHGAVAGLSNTIENIRKNF